MKRKTDDDGFNDVYEDYGNDGNMNDDNNKIIVIAL